MTAKVHKHVTAYRVTDSAGDIGIGVAGVVLCSVETGTIASWTWMDLDGNVTASMKGVKVADVCPACYAKGIARNLGHDGAHGGTSDLRLDDAQESTTPVVAPVPPSAVDTARALRVLADKLTDQVNDGTDPRPIIPILANTVRDLAMTVNTITGKLTYLDDAAEELDELEAGYPKEEA